MITEFSVQEFNIPIFYQLPNIRIYQNGKYARLCTEDASHETRSN